MMSEFSIARPVWPKELNHECNVLVGFKASFQRSGNRVELKLAAASLYRIFCNGKFVGYGPARAAHGYARVDKWQLNLTYLQAGPNFIGIEVVSYGVPSFYVLNEPPFLQAELIVDGQVIAATGKDGPAAFSAQRLTYRVQRVPRYSYQRPFVEVYRLAPSFADWRCENGSPAEQKLALEVRPPRRLLSRGLALPAFPYHAAKPINRGAAKLQKLRESYWKDRSLLLGGGVLGGFDETALEANPSIEAQDWTTISFAQVGAAPPSALQLGEFILYDLGRNLTGFVQIKAECATGARLLISFDEILTADDIDFHRLECVNLISYDLAPGEYGLETFEAYTCRYLKVLVVEGSCCVHSVSIRRYENSETGRASFQTTDSTLNLIFEAAEATYAQNTVDLLMDCPSRERAGWLNDSFFSGRSAFLFSGCTRVEDNFLENFALAHALPGIPVGMIPMCYPADSIEGGHTPNLPCWLICEIEEMRRRGANEKIIESFRPKVDAYFRYLDTFQNEHGLLENVPGWIFIEWSKANDWTQDVSVPFNLLFSDALGAAARVYGEPSWEGRSETIRKAVRNLAYDGTFFNDNLIRYNGQLKQGAHSSEICQYHAFWSGIATPKDDQRLWKTLVETCGPLPLLPKQHVLEPANMIMGRYMRFDLLARFGEHSRLLLEIKTTFAPMAESTGTLWEHLDHRASCNHGLAAHAAVSLMRDIAGISVDLGAKKIAIDLYDLSLSEGRVCQPLPQGQVVLKWLRLPGKRLKYRADAPQDFLMEIRNSSDLKLEPWEEIGKVSDSATSKAGLAT